MTTDRVTLTGYVARPADITVGSDMVLQVRFRLVHSPTDDVDDDATLPCVLYAIDTPRSDVEAFFVQDAAIRVTGTLHLPQQAGGRLYLEVADVDEEGDNEDDAVPALSEADLQIPDTVTTKGGKCVLTCDRPDGTKIWHIIAPSNGAVVTAANEALLPWAIRTLTRPASD